MRKQHSATIVPFDGTVRVPAPVLREYLAAPTMASRRVRAKAIRLAQEADQLPHAAIRRFAWVFDAKRRARGRKSHRNPNEVALQRVTKAAQKGEKQTRVPGIYLPNSTMLELIDLSNVSRMSINSLVKGFLASGIEALYNALEEAHLTLEEVRETHDTGESLARFGNRPSSRKTTAVSPPGSGDATRPSAARKFPTSQADGH